MLRLGLAYVFALLPSLACTHNQASLPAFEKTLAVESNSAPAIGALDSGSDVHSTVTQETGTVGSGSDAESTATQAADSIEDYFPKACTSICEPDFWECGCAFALKSGINPECTNEFAVDHGTKCDVETIHECLGVVLNRATARYDRELAQATTRALDCLHEADGS